MNNNFEKEFKNALCGIPQKTKFPQRMLMQTWDRPEVLRLRDLPSFQEKVEYLFRHNDDIQFLSLINETEGFNAENLSSCNIKFTSLFRHNEENIPQSLFKTEHRYMLNRIALLQEEYHGIPTVRIDFQDLEIAYPEDCAFITVNPHPGGDFFVWKKSQDQLSITLAHFSHRKEYISKVYRWIETFGDTLI